MLGARCSPSGGEVLGARCRPAEGEVLDPRITYTADLDLYIHCVQCTVHLVNTAH